LSAISSRFLAIDIYDGHALLITLISLLMPITPMMAIATAYDYALRCCYFTPRLICAAID